MYWATYKLKIPFNGFHIQFNQGEYQIIYFIVYLITLFMANQNNCNKFLFWFILGVGIIVNFFNYKQIICIL